MIQRIPLGPGGPEMFPIGLGGMPMSITGRPPEEQSIRTIHTALDAGMTLLDTADVYCLDAGDYGHNERLIAKALASYTRPKPGVLVATKGGLRRPEGRWTRDARPEQLKASCEASLQALGTDCIDLYQLHAPDEKLRFEDSVGALADLRKQGKIRLVGLSNVTTDQIRSALRIVPIASVQNRFSVFFREVLKDGVLETCTRLGLTFLPYSPLGGGRLHKKLADHPVALQVGKRHGATPRQAALAWVVSKSPVVLPIPGASRPESARMSAIAATIRLSPQDVAEMDAAEFSAA